MMKFSERTKKSECKDLYCASMLVHWHLQDTKLLLPPSGEMCRGCTTCEIKKCWCVPEWQAAVAWFQEMDYYYCYYVCAPTFPRRLVSKVIWRPQTGISWLTDPRKSRRCTWWPAWTIWSHALWWVSQQTLSSVVYSLIINQFAAQLLQINCCCSMVYW